LPKKQAVLTIGFPGTHVSSQDRHSLAMIQEYASDMAGPLFTRIREELGLAYQVGATQFLGFDHGLFTFYVATSPEQVDLARTELLAEIGKIANAGIPEEAFERVRSTDITATGGNWLTVSLAGTGCCYNTPRTITATVNPSPALAAGGGRGAELPQGRHLCSGPLSVQAEAEAVAQTLACRTIEATERRPLDRKIRPVKADPNFPVSCPHCGRKLVYRRTEDATHFYRCERNGMLILPPDGRVRVEDPENPATRH